MNARWTEERNSLTLTSINAILQIQYNKKCNLKRILQNYSESQQFTFFGLKLREINMLGTKLSVKCNSVVQTILCNS